MNVCHGIRLHVNGDVLISGIVINTLAITSGRSTGWTGQQARQNGDRA